jgi:hypothetical protein
MIPKIEKFRNQNLLADNLFAIIRDFIMILIKGPPIYMKKPTLVAFGTIAFGEKLTRNRHFR